MDSASTGSGSDATDGTTEPTVADFTGTGTAPSKSATQMSQTDSSGKRTTATVSAGTPNTGHPPANMAGTVSTSITIVTGMITTQPSNVVTFITDVSVPSDDTVARSSTDGTGATGMGPIGYGIWTGSATGPTVADFTGSATAPSKSATQVPQTDITGNPITESDDGVTPPTGATGVWTSATYSGTDNTNGGFASGTDGSGHGTDATKDGSGHTGATVYFSGRTGTPGGTSERTRDPAHSLLSYPPGRAGNTKANDDPLGSGMTVRPSNKATLGTSKTSGASTASGLRNTANSPSSMSASSSSDDPSALSSTPLDEGTGIFGPSSVATNGPSGGSFGPTVPGGPLVTTAVELGTVVPTDYPLVPINKTYTPAVIEKLIDDYGLDRNTTQTASLEAQVHDRMLEVMRNLDPAVRQQIGYQLRDFIIACSYDGEACDYDNDFEYMSDPDYGNCYTFNANGTHPIAGSGTDSGLRLIAFNNVSEYLYTTSKAGARVTLHKQNYAPFPNTNGYDVGVGSYASLSVQYNAINALSRPYGDCTPKDRTEGMVYEGWYTYEGCFRSCFQNDIIAKCGCADSRFPLPLDNSSLQYCGPSNEQGFICYQKHILAKGDYNAVQNCTCTTGCEESAYNVELSSAAWPIYFPNFTTPTCIGKYANTNVDCYTAFSENAVWIDISYDSSTYEYTSERPVMNGMDLFHNLSGAVCLWLGISMVALMEIVELLSYICLSSGFSPKKSPSVADMNGMVGADGFSPYAVDDADIYGPPATYFPPDNSR
ncbi:degenerin unc-8 [Aphelenchoides avenae]|nr:degenerin unc-8 [Aphelenchus avenae]